MSEADATMSVDVEFLARLRKARDKQSVLKMRFVDLRGRCPKLPILAFEGDDDKIAYGRWISRLKPTLNYEPFVCKGKNGVRSLQRMLINDLGSLRDDVFLFVDRDYDDALYLVENEWLFITDRYAVENYLVSASVVNSILRDELPCSERPDIRDTIVQLFSEQYDRFLDITEEFNRRLFIARRAGVALANSLPDKLTSFARLSLDTVEPAEMPIEHSIVYQRQISEAEIAALRLEFAQLDRRQRHRGKNAFLFFEAWVALLCSELALKTDSRFGGPANDSRIRRDELGIGTYASKSVIPLGLPAFIDRIAA